MSGWNVVDAGFNRLRATADAALRDLVDAVVEMCPGPHEAVQHRDMKPPWCAVCGRTDRGALVKEPKP